MADERNEVTSNADGLRTPELLCEPDSRTRSFVRMDRETGATHPLSTFDQYAAVAAYTLSEAVPEDVRILFDTARNLYVYAWFVYRFYNVAEQQVLACLEMALRERLKSEMPLPEKYWSKKKQNQSPTLQPMLRYVIDRGYIKNEGFRTWRERGVARAQQRYELDKTDEMKKKGLKSIEFDYSQVKVTEADLAEFDYLSVVLKYVSTFRNTYAHGSGMLYPVVLHSFELVSEIVNQLFATPQKEP